MQAWHVEQVDGTGELVKGVIDERVVGGHRRQCAKEGIVCLGARCSIRSPHRRLGIRSTTGLRGSERAHLATRILLESSLLKNSRPWIWVFLRRVHCTLSQSGARRGGGTAETITPQPLAAPLSKTTV